MTTVTESQPRPVLGRNRIINVVRLQFINRQTFVWVPALVLGGAWLITLLIYGVMTIADLDGDMIGGGSQAPLWYFLVVGSQAMALTFPFSAAMSLTRREFYIGSLAAAALSSLGMSLIFVLLGLIEKATNGYGINGYFAYLSWVWAAGPLGAGLTYFVASTLFFIIGFWAATVYKRGGAMTLTAVLVAFALALVGVVAFITWREAWPEVWTWLVDAGALGLTMWGLLVGVLLAIGSYLTLRRMPV